MTNKGVNRKSKWLRRVRSTYWGALERSYYKLEKYDGPAASESRAVAHKEESKLGEARWPSGDPQRWRIRKNPLTYGKINRKNKDYVRVEGPIPTRRTPGARNNALSPLAPRSPLLVLLSQEKVIAADCREHAC